MAWVFPRDLDAATKFLGGADKGADFARGAGDLQALLTREDRSCVVFGDRPRRTAVSYTATGRATVTLLALSQDADYARGVLALASILLPTYHFRELPGALESAREKLGVQCK